MRHPMMFIVLLLTCGSLLHASVIFQTVPEPAIFTFAGGGTLNSTQWLAEEFTVTQSVFITDVGGEFTYSNNKPIFGAILRGPLPSQSLAAFKSNISTLAVAFTTFTIPSAGGGAIVDAPLSVKLDPGTYELVIGAGTTASPVLGATGSAILTNCCVGDPGNEKVIKGNFPVQWAPNPNAYLFVKGDPVSDVPEPASATLLGGALMLLVLGLRRNQYKRSKALAMNPQHDSSEKVMGKLWLGRKSV